MMNRRPKKMLSVTVNPDALVPDYEAQDRGRKRFLNRKKNNETQTWDLINEGPIDVPPRAEYIKALKSGELIPANPWTQSFAR